MKSTIEEKAIAHDRVVEAIEKLLHLPHQVTMDSFDIRERGVRHWLYILKHRHERERTKLRKMNGEVVE